jgi:hypothetical protein
LAKKKALSHDHMVHASTWNVNFPDASVPVNLRFLCFYVKMDSKYCSSCARKRLLSFFLKNASADPGSKVFSTCFTCRDRCQKRKALQPLDSNIRAKGRIPQPTTAPTHPCRRDFCKRITPRLRRTGGLGATPMKKKKKKRGGPGGLLLGLNTDRTWLYIL